MGKYKTQQEEFWAGKFGDEWTERNKGDRLISTAVAMWSGILRRVPTVSSVLEIGAGLGLNLRAMRVLLPGTDLAGLEINASAAEELRKWGEAEVFEDSLFGFDHPQKFDMVFTKGLLIHIRPDLLNDAYDSIYNASGRYICLVEYYNPVPVDVVYRGNTGELFKRDFSGEMLDRFSDLHLVDYGFIYHRDIFPQDDINWFLMEKR